MHDMATFFFRVGDILQILLFSPPFRIPRLTERCSFSFFSHGAWGSLRGYSSSVYEKIWKQLKAKDFVHLFRRKLMYRMHHTFFFRVGEIFENVTGIIKQFCAIFFLFFCKIYPKRYASHGHILHKVGDILQMIFCIIPDTNF